MMTSLDLEFAWKLRREWASSSEIDAPKVVQTMVLFHYPITEWKTQVVNPVLLYDKMKKE